METTTVAAAIGLIWLGIVLGVSFLATPVKFRAQGVSIETGLAIGRVTFESLNAEEFFFAVALLAVTFAGNTQGNRPYLLLAAVLVLVLQLGAVRPLLKTQSDTVLREGDSGARSTMHYLYVGLEIVKVVVLAVGAFAALS